MKTNSEIREEVITSLGLTWQIQEDLVRKGIDLALQKKDEKFKVRETELREVIRDLHKSQVDEREISTKMYRDLRDEKDLETQQKVEKLKKLIGDNLVVDDNKSNDTWNIIISKIDSIFGGKG